MVVRPTHHGGRPRTPPPGELPFPGVPLPAVHPGQGAAATCRLRVERRFSLAVVLGLRAEYEGGRTKIRAAAGLYEELTAVLEREPEHARAQHLLGRLHAGVRRMNRITRFIATRLFGGSVLAGASWEDAERYLAFAEREVPDVSDHHMQLAALYRDTSRPGLARLEIRHVLAIEATSPMERAVRDQAIRLRAELSET